MKVLLTAINSKYIHSNLAVFDLKAYAAEYSEYIKIREFTINHRTDYILSEIYREKPDVLAFSCYIWNIEYVCELIKELSKILPNTQIWLGGPEVSFRAKEMLIDYPEVTGIMCGEGEATFKEVMSHYVEGIPEYSSIRGICYRVDNDNIAVNEWRETIPLDDVPFIYDNLSEFNNKIIYYESSRGCPFNCSYCLSSVDKNLRYRSLTLVKNELQKFLDAKVRQVKFVDRTFNCEKSRTMEIWRYIIDNDNGISNFHFEITANLLSEDEVELLSKARPGLIQLEIGVQSANSKTISAINRKMDIEKLKNTVYLLSEKAKVHKHLDLIAGLPEEDYESFGNSFDYVYEQRPEQLQLGFLKVLYGSAMHDKAREYGLVYKDKPPYEVLSTRWLSYGDIIKLKQIEEVVEIFYNTRQFDNTMNALLNRTGITPFKLYERLGEFYYNNSPSDEKHSRIQNYHILLSFIESICDIKEEIKLYKEVLTLDVYLRENIKSRPSFSADIKELKDEIRDFYMDEKNMVYLGNYSDLSTNQVINAMHLEIFEHDIFAFISGDKIAAAKTRVLFDYKERNPVNDGARYYIV